MNSTTEDGPRTRFGWSKPERLNFFGPALKAARTHYRLRFQEQDIDLPVVQLPIDLAKYRLMNGRTAALQEEYVATTGIDRDFFQSDPERIEAQEVQHGLLRKLISEENLDQHFRNTQNRQSDPLILDNEGFVLNGNRRLCAFRELLWADPDAYRHFESVRAVILPPSDDRALDRLEAALQLQPELRADYSWYAKAQMMMDRQRYHNLTIEELSSFYQRRKGEIEELLEMHRFAAEYLKSRGREGQWSKIGDNEFAFRQLTKNMRDLSGGDAFLFQQIAFNLIDDPTDGRLYQQIPNLRKHFNQVKNHLLVEFPIEPRSVENALENPLDPLAPEPGTQVGDAYLLAEVVAQEARREDVVEIARVVIQAQEGLAKERTTANLLLTKLRRAHAELTSAVTNGLTSDANLNGVTEELDHIEQKVAQVRVFTDGRDSPPQC